MLCVETTQDKYRFYYESPYKNEGHLNSQESTDSFETADEYEEDEDIDAIWNINVLQNY